MRRMHMRGRVRAVWPFVLPLAQVGRALPLPLPACMAGSIASCLDRPLVLLFAATSLLVLLALDLGGAGSVFLRLPGSPRGGASLSFTARQR